eukprot:GILK01001812.1.p1 GENE.GILK01001812.1~~GILK01001812.1.p1  ORF type:complete len:336 (+),score=13.43 GILK01001812.1:99-1106(+)
MSRRRVLLLPFQTNMSKTLTKRYTSRTLFGSLPEYKSEGVPFSIQRRHKKGPTLPSSREISPRLSTSLQQHGSLGFAANKIQALVKNFKPTNKTCELLGTTEFLRHAMDAADLAASSGCKACANAYLRTMHSLFTIICLRMASSLHAKKPREGFVFFKQVKIYISLWAECCRFLSKHFAKSPLGRPLSSRLQSLDEVNRNNFHSFLEGLSFSTVMSELHHADKSLSVCSCTRPDKALLNVNYMTQTRNVKVSDSNTLPNGMNRASSDCESDGSVDDNMWLEMQNARVILSLEYSEHQIAKSYIPRKVNSNSFRQLCGLEPLLIPPNETSGHHNLS